jgi:hypothetical protein
MYIALSHWILLSCRHYVDKTWTAKHNVHYTFSALFSQNRAVYEIMTKIRQIKQAIYILT